MHIKLQLKNKHNRKTPNISQTRLQIGFEDLVATTIRHLHNLIKISF